MTDGQLREIAELARRIHRVLSSRLPSDNSPGDFQIDKLAKVQAKDALETLITLVNHELARRLNDKL
jgi:hypothetical protein